MKRNTPKKASIDWYFPRVNGRVVLRSPSDLERRKKAEALGPVHGLKKWSIFRTAMILVLSAAPAFASAAETKTAALPALSKTAAAVKVQPTKAQAEEKKLKKVEKSLAGKIGFVRKTKMSVEFAADKEIGAEEMLFSVDQKVGLKNAKDFSKLAYGDEVRVKYTETYRLPEVPGKEEVLLGKVVTEIELIKSALAPKPVTDVMTKGEET